MIIETFAVGPLGCNCSLVIDPATKDALVVDPGGDFEKIKKRLEHHGAAVKAIVHTHTHIDHVGATAELQRYSGAAAEIHEGDRFLYDMLPVQASLIGMDLPEFSDLNGGLKDDATVSAGAVSIHVIHTPGHTPGSCCFHLKTPSGEVLFAGDTLFRRSVGRTDLWGGDSDTLVRSIRNKLYSLEETTRVVTGHGPDTSIGAERKSNPFVRPR